MEALKIDLDAKSRAATAGWDAAANAESEAEAAEARGLQAGINRGRAEVERKARYCELSQNLESSLDAPPLRELAPSVTTFLSRASRDTLQLPLYRQ